MVGAVKIEHKEKILLRMVKTMLRVKCVLFVYVCIFCIFGEDLLGYSYRWYV
jgi:hypothetical protein